MQHVLLFLVRGIRIEYRDFLNLGCMKISVVSIIIFFNITLFFHLNARDLGKQDSLKDNIDYKVQDRLKMACYSGDGVACYDLAVMYERGWGGSLSFDKARTFYRLACSYGVLRACSNLEYNF